MSENKKNQKPTIKKDNTGDDKFHRKIRSNRIGETLEDNDSRRKGSEIPPPRPKKKK